MKHYYKYTFILLLVTFAAASLYVFKTVTASQQKIKPVTNHAGPLLPVRAKPDVVPQGTMSKIQQGLAQREYHITFDAKKQSLQSPNRKQNLRAYYKPGIFTVQNRKDSAGHNFKLKLVNEGVYADGKKIHMPQSGAAMENKEGELNIDHAGFTEQYINNEEGVRQNFIVRSAPKGTSELQVRLSAEGLNANDLGTNELHFYDEDSDGSARKQLVYKDLKCWDATGRELIASLSYKNEQIVISVNASGASYPVTIDPIVVNGHPGNANALLESNQVGGNAGVVSSAGDINGDGYSDVLVGAPYYDKGEVNEGVVFVYHGSATGIGSNPVLTLESNQAECRFGQAVSTAGDVNKDGFSDVVVGAPYYDKGQANEGAAFIYHGSLAGLKPIASTVLEGNQVEAHFGNSVGLAGDVNGDGASDVIVGAPWYDKGQTDEGAAFVYHGSVAGVIANAAFMMESNQVAAKMGNSVAGAGDVNGDGYSDVVVGAWWYDKGQVNEGAVFIYHGSAMGIAGNAVSVMESNQAEAALGLSVAGAGDVNGDGYSDVIIGAYLYDNGHVNEGAAFVYHGSAAGININAVTVLESNQAEAQAGYSVASAGDVNGDGYGDVIVGANYYDNAQSNEGGAFVYQGSANGLAASAASVLESNQVNASLGASVASAGDVNGDGYSDIIVGAPLYDRGESDEGVAFGWHGMAVGIDITTSTSLDANQLNCLMGWSVSRAGDVNGDGYDDTIIGAFQYDNGQSDEGAAFLYLGSLNGINDAPSVILESNINNAELGKSVSSAGDINSDGYDDVIIGAFLYSNGEDYEGAAYIYYGSIGGLDKNTYTILQSNQANALMGRSVSSAGDVNGDGYGDVVVGAEAFDNGQFNEGAAFVYHGSANGIIPQFALRLESDQETAYMGYSVSGAGDVNGDGYGDIIVGAPYYIKGQRTEGRATVYYGSSNGISALSKLTLEENQPDSEFGWSVSKAGDINGDGYADIIVGAPGYDNNLQNEGAAFVYNGSAAGLNSNFTTILNGNQSESRFASSVSATGDINGDGYSDIIIGAPHFYKIQKVNGNNVKLYNGKAFLFCGSEVGVKTAPMSTFEVLEDQSEMGQSVSGAGDVNGDGYSDIVIGCPQFGDTGAAFVCYGNTGACLKNNLRLYNTNLTTPINQTQFSQNNFGAGLYAKSFLGRNKGKLVWETRAKGQGFSKGGNNVITNSTQSTGSQNAYASLGLAGAELKSVIAKQGPATKVRVRVKYDPALALTGQTYGPWRYLPAYLTGSSIAPVPEDAMAETVKRKAEFSEKSDFAATVSIYPNPVSDKLFVESKNPGQIHSMQLLTSNGRSVYKSTGTERTVDVRNLESGVYILILTHSDGSQVSKKVMIRK